MSRAALDWGRDVYVTRTVSNPRYVSTIGYDEVLAAIVASV